MAKPEVKARFVSSMLRFAAAVKAEGELCSEICGDLNEKELLVIIFAGEHENVKMSDLADNLKTPLSTLTGIVDKLVGKKYLARVHSEQDRRVVNITLQNNGRTAFKTFLARKEEMVDKVLAAFTVIEQRAFIEYLDKMSSILESVR
jgi:DNA-binding MarR family transcriptional regulator